jgi:creatinine amidohydrolase
MRRDSTSHAVLPALGLALVLGTLIAPVADAADPARGQLAGETRVAYYLPHMTWDEVEQYLRTSDMVIIPVGSIEQHGKHLPLGSDSIAAVETSMRIGQKTGVLVAPAVLAGVSEHHMGFPGTISLTPATLEAVLYDTARSLIAHGFKRIMFLNGHGGNETTVTNVAYRINRETAATAIDLWRIDLPPTDARLKDAKLDYHAGVEETSTMMYLAGGLVQMSKAENPKLTFPASVHAISEKIAGRNQEALDNALLFQPERSGKGTSTREISSNGVVTTGDLKTASAEIGRAVVEANVEAVVRFIETWQQIRP